MREYHTVRTQSGSHYVFTDDFAHVLREPVHPLRRDEEWVRVIQCSPIEIGQPMRMLLDLELENGALTLRTTSPVTAMWTTETN